MINQTIVPPSTFGRDMSWAYNNPMYANVQFIVNGIIIKAHRAILVARSSYFKSMLSSGFKEATEGNITIDEMDYKQLESILAYTYTDELLDATNPQLTYDLFCSSGLYALDTLQRRTESLLCKFVTPDNSLLLWEVAELHNGSALKEACFNVIINQLTIPWFNEHFESFTPLLIKKINEVRLKQGVAILEGRSIKKIQQQLIGVILVKFVIFLTITMYIIGK